jgi:hypothetical protein
MKRAAVLLVLLAACGDSGDDDGPPPPDASTPFTECDGTDQSFVRQASLALLGRRPHGQAEVNVYADLMTQVRALAPADEGAGGQSGALDPRVVAARALAADPSYVERWSEHFMDALQVPRIEVQSQRQCYGVSMRDPDEGIVDGSLALAVRDREPTDGGDGQGRFTMRDLLRSAIHLDDLSVVYRAHLYALVSRPIPAANVPPIQAELARREDYGTQFDAAYLNRDLVCLGCHNSDDSVTFSPEPSLNRHWPMPGSFERAIYGASTGVAAERAHAAFRFAGLVVDPTSGSSIRPWGWDGACGAFAPNGLAPDPAGVDGKLASLSGDSLTVFDLEAALRRGFDALAARGLVTGEDGAIDDPDAAMAYLVAASMVEGVWREVIGTPLTIANDFPRNQAARDLLAGLTDGFIASRYSLRGLLVAIVTSDYFDRLPPEAGCGAGPYDMPAVYDPWVTSDPEPARRGNGPGDAVVPLSPRVLLRAAHDALEWPRPFFYEFPEESPAAEACVEAYTCSELADLCQRGTCCEGYQVGCVDRPEPGEPPAPDLLLFQRGIGVFLKHAERGFRGLDFQARLVFEEVFGACANQGALPDFVDQLIERAQEEPSATLGDVVAALKDRLVGQARVSRDGSPSELEAIEALFGAAIAAPASSVDALADKTRALCGVLLSSPLFLLSGIAPPDASEVPLLTPEEAGYAAICNGVVDRVTVSGLLLTCGDRGLTVSSPP